MNAHGRTARELHRLIDDALDQDGRRSLVAVRQLTEHLGWLEQRAVIRARSNGLSWAKIGRLLGRTAQAVRQRHRDLPALPVRRSAPSQAEEILLAWERLKRHGSAEADDDPVAW